MQYYLNRRYYPVIGGDFSLNYGFTVVNPPSPHPKNDFTTNGITDDVKIARRQLIDGNVVPISIGHAKRHAAYEFSYTLAEVYNNKLGGMMGHNNEFNNRSVVFNSSSLIVPRGLFLSFNRENHDHQRLYRSGQRQIHRIHQQGASDTSPVEMTIAGNNSGDKYDYKNYHPLLNRTSDYLNTHTINKHSIFGLDVSKPGKNNYFWGIKDTGIYIGKGITVAGIPDGNDTNLPTLITTGTFSRMISRYHNRKSVVYPHFHEWMMGNDVRNVKPVMNEKIKLLLNPSIKHKLVSDAPELTVREYGSGAESIPLVLANRDRTADNWNADGTYVSRVRYVQLESVAGNNTIKDSRFRLINFKGNAVVTVNGEYIPKDEEHYYFVRSSFVAKGADGVLDNVYLYSRGPIHFDHAYGKHFQSNAHGQFLFGFTTNNNNNISSLNLPVVGDKQVNADMEYYNVTKHNKLTEDYLNNNVIKKWFALIPCMLTRSQRIKIEMKTGMIELLSDDPKDVFIFQRSQVYLPGYRESFEQFAYKQINGDNFDNNKYDNSSIGFNSPLRHMNGDLFGDTRYAFFNTNMFRSCYYDVVPDPVNPDVMYIVHPDSVFKDGYIYLKQSKGWNTPSSVPGIRDGLSMEMTWTLNSTANRPNDRGVMKNNTDAAHNLAFGRRQIYQRYFANFQAPWVRQADHRQYSLPFRTSSVIGNDMMKIQPMANMTDYNTIIVHPRAFDDIPDWYPGFKAGMPTNFQQVMHTYPSTVTYYLHGLTDDERRQFVKHVSAVRRPNSSWEMFNFTVPVADRVWVIPQDDVAVICLDSDSSNPRNYANYRIVLNPNRTYVNTDKIRILIVDAGPVNRTKRHRLTTQKNSPVKENVYFYEVTLSGNQINDSQTIKITEDGFAINDIALQVDRNESNRSIKELTNLNPRFKHYLWVLLGTDFNSNEKLPNLVQPVGTQYLFTGTQSFNVTTPTSKTTLVTDRIDVKILETNWRGSRPASNVNVLDELYLYPYSERDCESDIIKTSQTVPLVVDNVVLGLDADEEKIYWDQILPIMPIYPIYVDYGQSTNTRTKHIPWGFTAPPNKKMLNNTPIKHRFSTYRDLVNGGDYYANDKNGSDNKWYFGYNRNGNENLDDSAKPYITVYGWDIHGVWRAYDIVFKDTNFLEFGQWQEGLDVRDHRDPQITYAQAKQKLIDEGWGERQYIHYKCNGMLNNSDIYLHFDLNKGIIPMLEVGSSFNNVPATKSKVFNYMKLDDPNSIRYFLSGQTTDNRPTSPRKIRIKDVKSEVPTTASDKNNVTTNRVITFIYEHVEQAESNTYNPYIDLNASSLDTSVSIMNRSNQRGVRSRSYDASKKELSITHLDCHFVHDSSIPVLWSKAISNALNYIPNIDWEDRTETVCKFRVHMRLRGDTNNLNTDNKSNCFSRWTKEVRVVCSEAKFDPDTLSFIFRNVPESFANNIQFYMITGNSDSVHIPLRSPEISPDRIVKTPGNLEGYVNVSIVFDWPLFRNVVLKRLFSSTLVPPETPMRVVVEPEGLSNKDAKWLFRFNESWFRNKDKVWFKLI